MKASYIKMPPAAEYSFLSCPDHTTLQAEPYECGSILWVIGAHFLPNEITMNFFRPAKYGEKSFYRTKSSKALL